MLKIMLKEPVGGMIGQSGASARQTAYMLVVGVVDNESESAFDRALGANESLRFTTPQGKNLLIPASNIAYILETDEQPTG